MPSGWQAGPAAHKNYAQALLNVVYNAPMLDIVKSFKRTPGDPINVLDIDASYSAPSDLANTSNCVTPAKTGAFSLCKVAVSPSNVPKYCTDNKAANGKPGGCVFWAPNTNANHKDLGIAVAAAHVQTGSGVIARNRAASGKYMMCVKMPQQSGASFSSWLFGYQSALQGDSEWLHQAGAKRNSEADFMESSYFNPAKKVVIDPAESDFGTYGGMISNTGSASYRDYYHLNPATSASKYVWMGYDYHTGQRDLLNRTPYSSADTYDLANKHTLNMPQGRKYDAVQNSRTGAYIDIYVDPTSDCTADGNITSQNFNSIWDKHVSTGRLVKGDQSPNTQHTIIGAKHGLGWLPNRYMRWTVALWNPASLTITGTSSMPYDGWSGTPLSSWAGMTQDQALEADVSYLAMEPKSDPRDKVEFDTGATYWSDMYDDSALNMNASTPAFNCSAGFHKAIIKNIAGDNADINTAFAMVANDGTAGSSSIQVSDSQAMSKNFAKHIEAGSPNMLDVCIPDSDSLTDLYIKIAKQKDPKMPYYDAIQCYSNNHSDATEADISWHVDAKYGGGWPDCKTSV